MLVVHVSDSKLGEAWDSEKSLMVVTDMTLRYHFRDMKEENEEGHRTVSE